jgi:tetratricopeptide (TPR) repeat protein
MKSQNPICPNCGSAIENAFKFCPACGISLSQNLLDLRLKEVLHYQRHGKNWEAMERLKDLAAAYHDDAYIHKLLGNTYFHMGLLDWAIESYNKALVIDSNYIDAHYDLGVALYHRARVREAIAEYLMVLKLDPDYHAAHYRIGLCYHHSGQFNAAIHHLLEATVLTPEYVMAHYHLGVLYFKQGEFRKARLEFERVLEEDPNDTSSAKYVSQIEEQLNHKLEEGVVASQEDSRYSTAGNF